MTSMTSGSERRDDGVIIAPSDQDDVIVVPSEQDEQFLHRSGVGHPEGFAAGQPNAADAAAGRDPREDTVVPGSVLDSARAGRAMADGPEAEDNAAEDRAAENQAADYPESDERVVSATPDESISGDPADEASPAAARLATMPDAEDAAADADAGATEEQAPDELAAQPYHGVHEAAPSDDTAAPGDQPASDGPTGPGESAAPGESATSVPLAPAASATPASTASAASAAIPQASAPPAIGDWPAIQSLFVDDPRRAVEQAADVTTTALDQLVEAARGREQELRQHWQHEGADTEELRTALRGYRELVGRIADLSKDF